MNRSTHFKRIQLGPAQFLIRRHTNQIRNMFRPNTQFKILRPSLWFPSMLVSITICQQLIYRRCIAIYTHIDLLQTFSQATITFPYLQHYKTCQKIWQVSSHPTAHSSVHCCTNPAQTALPAGSPPQHSPRSTHRPEKSAPPPPPESSD